MKKFFIFFLLIFSSFIFSMELNFKQYLHLIKENDYVIKRLLNEKKAISLNYLIEQPNTEFIFNIGLYADIFADSSISPALDLRTTKLLEETATSFTGSFSSNKTSQSSSETQKFSLTFEQPLIANSLGYQFKLAEKVRILKSQDSLLKINEKIKNRTEELLLLYYDWYLAYQEYLIENRVVNEYKRLLTDIQDRKRNYVAREIEVNKIKNQVLIKEAGLISKEQLLKNYNEKIALFLNFDFKEIFPLEKDSKKLYIFFEQILKEDNNSSKYLELIHHIEKNISSLNISILKDKQKMPLVLGATWQNTQTVGSSSSSKMQVGLGFSFPYENKQNKSLLELTILEHENLLLRQEEEKLSLKLELLLLEDNIFNENRNMQLLAAQIKLLESIANEEKDNYLRGQINLNQLIQAINDLELIKLQSIRNVNRLEKLKIQWLSKKNKLNNFLDIL
jgi:outer membrane protein TolC